MFWNIILGIASYFLNLVLSPKPQTIKPASLSDFNVPISEEGVEIPIVFGTVLLKSPNVVWYGDLRLQNITKGRRYGFFGPKITVGYRYGLGLHMVLCHAMQDQINEIWAGDKKLFPKAPDTDPFVGTGVLVIDQMNIFGGDEGEGGVFGSVHVLSGGPGQLQDAYLASVLPSGANTPAFRGVVSMVWEHLYIGNSPYLRPWSIVLKRIHKNERGDEQWYDAKAAIPETANPAGTEPGVALNPGVATHNYEGKVDTNGAYAARIDEFGSAGHTVWEQGSLRVWHLPDGAMQYYDVPNPNAGIWPTGKFAGLPLITSYGEVLIGYYGSAWGNVTWYLQAYDVANLPTKTQSDISMTAALNAEGVTHSNLSGWTLIDESSDGQYVLLKVSHQVQNSAPWVLLERSDDEWIFHSAHQGETAQYTTWGFTTLSMGPEYAYCIHANGIVRVSWHPDNPWSEDLYSWAYLQGLGMTSGGSVWSCFLWETTNEVVVIKSDGIFVFNADLTTLLRSRTSFPTALTNFTTSRRVEVTTSTFMVRSTNGVSYDKLWEISVGTLDTMNEVDVFASSYVNKGTSHGSGYMYFNRDSDGMVIIRHSLMPLSFWPYNVPDAPDMNPSHIIRECIVNATWGMGYAEADVDDDKFTYAADVLYDELCGISVQWAREERIEEFISIILSHIDAYLFLRRDTGKFELKLVRNDYDVNTIPHFGEDDVEKWDKITRRQPPEAVDSVTAKYTNRRNRYKDGSLTYDNIAQIQQLGRRINVTRFYPGFNRQGLADRAAKRDQKTLGAGLVTGRVIGKRQFDQLYPGYPFRLTSARHNLAGEVMRCASLRFGDGRTNGIGCEFAQDIFRLSLEEELDPTVSDWEDPLEPPSPAEPRYVGEAPYRELVELIGPSDANTLLSLNRDDGLLHIAAGSPSGLTLSAYIYVNGVDSGESMTFAPAGLLAAQLLADPTATTMTLSDEVDEDLVTVGMLAVVSGGSPATTEIVRVAAVSSPTYTIERGMLDTVPLQNEIGATVVFYDGASFSDFEPYSATDDPTVKLLTRTVDAVLASGSAPSDTADFDSRAIRPLRPANVTVDGAAVGPYNGTGLTEFMVDLAGRSRLSQIGSSSGLKEWTDSASDVLESGQTLVLEVMDPFNSTVVTTHAGLVLADFPYAVPLADFGGNPSGWIRVGSSRTVDSVEYREWQNFPIEVLVDLETLELDGEPLELDGEPLVYG